MQGKGPPFDPSIDDWDRGTKGGARVYTQTKKHAGIYYSAHPVQGLRALVAAPRSVQSRTPRCLGVRHPPAACLLRLNHLPLQPPLRLTQHRRLASNREGGGRP